MLTQAEIDALLSGAIAIEGKDGEGEVNLAELMGQSPAAPAPVAKEGDGAKKISAYNFWSPDRFSKDQMRAVELVHEDLAERLTTSLPTFIRSSLRPRLVHTEQGRFQDFLADMPENCLFHMITLAPLPGQVVLTISPNISYLVIEQRLGGKIEGEPKDRVLTDIDQSLLRGLVEHMLNDMKSAWSKVATVEPNLDDSTTNQHWVQMMMGNERVMLLTFEMSLQGVTGTMNIYIPFTTLKPIANVLNPHVWITGRKEKIVDPAAREMTMKSLAHVKLPVQVFLGNAEISLNEVLNLEVGDILPLDTNINAPLIMRIANQDLFRTQIGKVGNRLAVQVIAANHDEPSITI